MANPAHCISLTAILLGGFFVSCQSASFGPPEILAGDEARQAYQTWTAELSTELEYPAQVHLDYTLDMTIDMSSAGMPEPMKMDMAMNADYVVSNAQDLVLWGNLDLGAVVEGEQHRLNFDFEVADNHEGLRMLLDDHGFFLQELGVEVPTAYSLSQDRLETLTTMYAEVIEEMSVLYGQSLTAIYAGVEGPGDLFHPGNFMRFMAKADVFNVIGWSSADGKVVIQATLDSDFIEGSFGAGVAPFDTEVFEDMVFEIVADLASGVMLDYSVDMRIPIEAPLSPGSEQVIQMDMGLKMHLTTIDVDPAAPRVVLPAEDVMNLDFSFDQYLPLIQVALDMQKQQMKQMSGEKEGGEDFSF